MSGSRKPKKRKKARRGWEALYVRLPTDLRRELDDEASRSGESLATLVRTLLRDGLTMRTRSKGRDTFYFNSDKPLTSHALGARVFAVDENTVSLSDDGGSRPFVGLVSDPVGATNPLQPCRVGVAVERIAIGRLGVTPR